MMIEISGRNAYVITKALEANGWARDRLEAISNPEERGVVIAYCLYQFVRQQQLLSDDQREWSVEQDAKALLRNTMPETLKTIIEISKERGETVPDLCSDGGPAHQRISELGCRKNDAPSTKVTGSPRS
jgi:hypothetical protein